MTPRAIHHVALRVADPEASRAFYAGVLGLAEVRRLDDEGGRVRSIWLRCGDAVLMLERALKGAGPASGSGHVLVLEVDALGGLGAPAGGRRRRARSTARRRRSTSSTPTATASGSPSIPRSRRSA